MLGTSIVNMVLELCVRDWLRPCKIRESFIRRDLNGWPNNDINHCVALIGHININYQQL